MGMFYPELTEPEIVSFEQKHGIRLPAGFRQFLKHLGNGGEGPPGSGIVPLGMGPKRSDPGEVVKWMELPDIRLPFPFTKPWIWEVGEISEEGTREQVDHGSIFLGEDGCGQEWHLIVTGTQRGKIWWFCGEGIQPLSPPRDFVRWYVDWLDGTEDWWTEIQGAF
jgi:hypothetical protein